jgi:hypothetical protein
MITQLLSIPPGAWVLDRILCDDWYDGPLSGFCSLIFPPIEFYFERIGERHNPDGLDDRLFQIRQIRNGAVSELLNAMKDLGEPQGKIWSPIWTHPNAEYLRSLSERIENAIEAAGEPQAIIYTRDWSSFLGCWQLTAPIASIDDWFSFLGI